MCITLFPRHILQNCSKTCPHSTLSPSPFVMYILYLIMNEGIVILFHLQATRCPVLRRLAVINSSEMKRGSGAGRDASIYSGLPTEKYIRI